jgi:hypothetical protein
MKKQDNGEVFDKEIKRWQHHNPGAAATNGSASSTSDLLCCFDKEKLLELAKLYLDDFNHRDMVLLNMNLVST